MQECRQAEQAENIAETHDNFSGFIYGALPIFELISKTYGEIINAFYMVAWVNDTLAVVWRTLSYLWSYNKNLHNTSNIIFEWLQFGVGAALLFTMGAVLTIAQIMGVAAMLVINPFICFGKSLYYLVKMLTADTADEAESHYDNVKTNVTYGMISGGVGMLFAPFLAVPALPLAAVIALTTISAVVFIPASTIGIIKAIYTFGSWAYNKVSKWWRKRKGLQGPGHQYDMRSGECIENEDLEENVIYIDKLAQDDIAHKFLFYRIKDDAGKIRIGTFKQYALPEGKENVAWPQDLSEKEIHKLRPYLNSFASSLLDGKNAPVKVGHYSNEKEEIFHKAASAIFPESAKLPIHFKPKIKANVVNELIINNPELNRASLALPVPMPEKKVAEAFHQKQKLYLDKERSDHHAHLCAPKLKSVDELIVDAHRQIKILSQHDDSYMHFFQQQKRQNKINALQELVKVMVQWNELYKDKQSNYLEYHALDLDDKTQIIQVLNPHMDPDVTCNKETLIARVQKHVLTEYPDAFQSFFREQGSVATLFQQGFDLMRSMKTNAEIIKERNDIETEIKAYEDKFDGWRKHFYSDIQIQNRKESVCLLRTFLDKYMSADDVMNSDYMKSSCVSNGERWQLYKKIQALHESEEMLNMSKPDLDKQAVSFS